MVLENAHIVVLHCFLIIHLHEEVIIDSRMFKIMHCRRNVTTHLLKVIQFELVFHAAVDAEVIERCADIRRVRLIMVSDLLISCGQIPNEAHQVCQVEVARGEETVTCQDERQNRLQLPVMRVLAHLEDVEVVGVYLLKLVHRLDPQLEHPYQHILRHGRPQLRHYRFRLSLFLTELKAVVLEAALCNLSELGVPCFHTVLQINLLEPNLLQLLASTTDIRVVACFREFVILLILIIKVLLVQLISCNHPDAVLEGQVRFGIGIVSNLDFS